MRFKLAFQGEDGTIIFCAKNINIEEESKMSYTEARKCAAINI